MRVRIYTTPTCPWCEEAKRFLSSRGVAYEELNVARDQGAAREMIAKSGQTGVPVIEINGTIIVGFDPVAIERALRRARA